MPKDDVDFCFCTSIYTIVSFLLAPKTSISIDVAPCRQDTNNQSIVQSVSSFDTRKHSSLASASAKASPFLPSFNFKTSGWKDIVHISCALQITAKKHSRYSRESKDRKEGKAVVQISRRLEEPLYTAKKVIFSNTFLNRQVFNKPSEASMNISLIN